MGRFSSSGVGVRAWPRAVSRLLGCVVVGLVGLAIWGIPDAGAVTVDWVTVGDPGNVADTSGFGAVGYGYRIGKFEFTFGQYMQFLNAVDPDGTNPASLYNQIPGYRPFSNSMGDIPYGGISLTMSNAPGTKYGLLPNMGDKPVTSVSWFNAARVANWLHNGAETYSTSTAGAAAIGNGAYTLGSSIGGGMPARNPDARVWIPSEDEWYKAAYYKGGGTTSGYWPYASQANALTPVFCTVTGSGTRDGMSPVTAPGYANYNYSCQWNLQPDGFHACHLLTVGTTGKSSAYGTYEQTGNVWEYVTVSFAASGTTVIRGGGFTSGDNTSSTNSRIVNQNGEGNTTWYGFRLATTASSPSPIPEIDPAGLASVVALLGGVLGWVERRRLRATRRRRSGSAGGAAVALVALAISGMPDAGAVTIDWVTVGAEQNPTGANSWLAIPYDFRIMKFEFTNAQYTQFLNAVDPDGLNPDSIYSSNMGSNARGGIALSAASLAGAKYSVRPNMGDKPVNYVSWFGAARVANWLQAGAQSYGSTVTGSAAINNGAYTLNGATTGDAPVRNPGAQYAIPYDSEWFKAAMFKRGQQAANPTARGDSFWTYPTQSDTQPGAVSADAFGNGTAGAVGNSSNWQATVNWNGQTGNVTTIGTNGGPSPYGTFDMSGNVAEWVDESGVYWFRGSRAYMVGLGGNLYNGYSNVSPFNNSLAIGAFNRISGFGFRLVGLVIAPVSVPEIDPAGLASVIAFVSGALGWLERRRIGG